MTSSETLMELGLTVESKFVPFSQSRNKAEKNPSLNWTVTIKRNGHDVLTCDYSAGLAHCPSYNKKPPAVWYRPIRFWNPLVCGFECESGFAIGPIVTWRHGFVPDRKKPILPDPESVVHSLVMDSSVLDSAGFEDWASEMGYDTDSRQAESIYRACLEIALKMRGAIGDSGMEKLKIAYQDY